MYDEMYSDRGRARCAPRLCGSRRTVHRGRGRSRSRRRGAQGYAAQKRAAAQVGGVPRCRAHPRCTVPRHRPHLAAPATLTERSLGRRRSARRSYARRTAASEVRAEWDELERGGGQRRLRRASAAARGVDDHVLDTVKTVLLKAHCYLFFRDSIAYTWT